MGKPLALVLCLSTLACCSPAKWRPASYHVATADQMVMRQDDGGVKFGVDLGDTFRSELRSPTGALRGVYSWVPSGDAGAAPAVVAYASDDAGNYRTMQLSQLGVSLPPFPYSLYNNDALPGPIVSPDGEVLKPFGALDPKVRYPEEVQDDAIAVEALAPTARSNGHFNGAEEFAVTLADADYFPYDDDDEDELDEEAVLVGEGGDERPPPPQGVLPPVPGALPVPVPPGTPIAQSLPVASAEAGPGGLAQATPAASAIVGPGGVAIAFPTAEAVVSAGGVSVSRPTATSQSGAGGVAIAGGQSVAVSFPGNLQQTPPAPPPSSPPRGEGLPQGVDEAGFVSAKDLGYLGYQGAASSTSFHAQPIVANYFFNEVPEAVYRDILDKKTNAHQYQPYTNLIPPYKQGLNYIPETKVMHYQQRYRVPTTADAVQSRTAAPAASDVFAPFAGLEASFSPSVYSYTVDYGQNTYTADSMDQFLQGVQQQ